MTELELRTTAMAVGGEAIAREPSGRVVFVQGAAPGETVRVALTDERKTFARGRVVDVVSPSADRVRPPCPHVLEGCGGCDWQHLAVEAQQRLRIDAVAELLAREAHLDGPLVEAGVAVPAERVRTTLRGTVDEHGRFALRRRRSHEPVPVDTCLVSHPLLEDVLARSRFDGATEVTVRVGARTGDRMVLVAPSIDGAVVPDGVVLVGADELAAGRRAWIHEQAAGRRWRVSAGSFFQSSPEGAEALVAEVAAAVDAWAPDAERVVDLCSGVGLFTATVGAGRSVVGVERSASAVADARVNTADLDARFVKVALGRWRPSPADVVIADPPRRGLAAEGVDVVVATGAPLVVLVSCDPAALARDARLLVGAGYEHRRSAVLDLFGHTSQIEVVSTFVHPGAGAAPYRARMEANG